MPNIKINYWLAFIVIIAAFLLFGAVVLLQLGGENALFAVLGYVSAWAQMIIIFFFRTSPNTAGPTTTTTTRTDTTTTPTEPKP